MSSLSDCSRRGFIAHSAMLCAHLSLTPLFISLSIGSAYGRTTDNGFEPAYLKLHQTGELKRRAQRLQQLMESCSLCPRLCGVNRLQGEIGFCRSPGTTLVISSAHPHFGEERSLVGHRGSGTIFFAHCNLRCVFCQNWEISHTGRGNIRTEEQLADMMMLLQQRGCHNINLVTPTHYSAAILAALDIAAGKGLRLPIVYNTSGWERLEILQVLDGVVDIYLPDFKFWDPDTASQLMAAADDYPAVTRAAILEMQRQVGIARPNKEGLMERGLMIRHLVMPNNKGGSAEIIHWIADNLPRDTYINIMAQFTPHFRAFDFPKISRRITSDEYRAVVDAATSAGLTHLDIQGHWWLRP